MGTYIMKDNSSEKDLGGGKWYINIDYSHHHNNTSNLKKVKFEDSKTHEVQKKRSEQQLRTRIASLEFKIPSLMQQISEKENQLHGLSADSEDFFTLQRQLKKKRNKLQRTQKEIRFLRQQLPSPIESSSYPKKSRVIPEHKVSPAPSQTSAVSKSIYPEISIGDCLFHKTFGTGIVYSVGKVTFKAYFSKDSTTTFTFQDSSFESNVLSLKCHWKHHQGTYVPTIQPDKFPVPIELQKNYAQFLANQTIDLKHSISKLCSVSDNYSLKYYAQCALDSIYNIEHSQQVFLSLQNKLNSPAPRQKKAFPPEKTSSTPPVPAPMPLIPALSIQFKPSTDTLYVYSGRIRCIRDKHNMVCANAHIETASGETAILNVNCCLNCNRFYISYDEYSRYMEKYKSLLTRIVLVDESGNSSFTNNLAAESTLKLCGYTVSQEKGFTSKERANLLANIIHNRIVSKPDVIQHLNWLIRMNGKKAGNDIAKEKWEEDLAFVRSLDTNSQSDYQIRHVAPYSFSKKRRK